MDVDAALARLLELSSQVQAAVILSGSGEALGAAPPGSPRADALAAAAPQLLDEAASFRRGGIGVEQVEVRLPAGGLFAVREGDLVALATTCPDPVEALVVYDLRTCLQPLVPEDGEE